MDDWAPHVTVAAVIERDGRYLMVEERDETGRRVVNQPAGHLDPEESLLEAVVRETREETGHAFAPQALVGVYQWANAGGDTFLRFAFTGSAQPIEPRPALDVGILRAAWFAADELAAPGIRLRSPMVLHCIEDARAGRRIPLQRLQRL